MEGRVRNLIVDETRKIGFRHAYAAKLNSDRVGDCREYVDGDALSVLRFDVVVEAAHEAAKLCEVFSVAHDIVARCLRGQGPNRHVLAEYGSDAFVRDGSAD